jgi:hypothetical protein
VIEQNFVGKRPLGRPRMRWKDIIKKDVEQLGDVSNWRNLALDREGWELGCKTGWSLRPNKPKKKKNEYIISKSSLILLYSRMSFLIID